MLERDASRDRALEVTEPVGDAEVRRIQRRADRAFYAVICAVLAVLGLILLMIHWSVLLASS